LRQITIIDTKEVTNRAQEYLEIFWKYESNDKILWFVGSTRNKEKCISNEETKRDTSKAPTALLLAVDKNNIGKDGTSLNSHSSRRSTYFSNQFMINFD
jgi:hypothetical protein